MRTRGRRLAALVVAASALSSTAAARLAADTAAGEIAFRVEDIGLEHMTQRRGSPRAGRSIRDLPITLGGKIHEHGIGTRSISEFVIDLHGDATRFESTVGLDSVVSKGVGSVVFEVWADDVRVASSGLMLPGDTPRLLRAGLSGARVLTLLLDDGGDTSNDDEAAWADATIYLRAGAARPTAFAPP